MKLRSVHLVVLSFLPAVAAADSLTADPRDYGKVTHIKQGVKELDLGGMFVLSHNRSGDAEGATRVQTLGGASFQYFIRDNLSAGAAFLASYDRVAANQDSKAFGAAVFGSLHLRLGLGAFLRPTFGVGALAGSQETEIAPGMVLEASQVAGLVRLALPFAYFPSRRIVLSAGPELNVMMGSVTPLGGEATSFVTVAGGFGVSAGYVF
jgi:hypothetical protein